MQALDAFLRQATTCGMVPGAVVCVAYRGQIVWHQAYGAAALTPQYRPMQCDTFFDIASLTKVVATTSLVLLAHHEGVCHLDDTLQHFYPQTRGTSLSSTTVRQLLAHLLAREELLEHRHEGRLARQAGVGRRHHRRDAAEQREEDRRGAEVAQSEQGGPAGYQRLLSSR